MAHPSLATRAAAHVTRKSLTVGIADAVHVVQGLAVAVQHAHLLVHWDKSPAVCGCPNSCQVQALRPSQIFSYTFSFPFCDVRCPTGEKARQSLTAPRAARVEPSIPARLLWIRAIPVGRIPGGLCLPQYLQSPSPAQRNTPLSTRTWLELGHARALKKATHGCSQPCHPLQCQLVLVSVDMESC